MSRAAPVFAVLAAALAGGIAWQLSTADGDGPAAPSMPRAEPASPATVQEPGRAADWTTTILARPLFSPDRRPPAPPAAAPQAAIPDAPLPRLAGIIVTPQGRRAIFAGQPQPVVVAEGGLIGRFSVQHIEPGQVTLAGAGGPHTLRPAFDPTPPARTIPGQLAPSLPLQGQALPGQVLPGPRPLAIGLPPIPGGTAGGTASAMDAPDDATPFASKPIPSGIDILREQTRRSAAEVRQ